MYIQKVKYYYKLIKQKNIDGILIFAGIVGVVVGLWTGYDIVNHISVWPILIGTCIKLYDFTEKIERNIVPYDFNRILPPPSKKRK